MKDKTDVYCMNVGEINKPVAYCVDLEEDALIEASKILGLEPTDVNFLDTPLYTHPMRELTDEEIWKCHDKTNTDNWVIDFARAIIKANRGEK
jgi:hypothetical protein